MMLRRIEELFGGLLKLIAAASFVVLLVLVSLTVGARFFPIASTGWSDELIELGFAWMVFVGSAAVWRERAHFRADMILVALKHRPVGRVLSVLLNLVSVVFFVIFLWLSWDLTVAATDSSPVLDLPRYLWYGVMPISGAIMLAYALRDLWRRD
jgi:TRAP-type C4-dicarboxylate transport system permease small subunit